MDLCKVINKRWTRIHWIDADKYKKVSRSKTICGLPGKQVWQPMAVWFGGCPECKHCKRVRKKNGIKHPPY